MDQPQKFSQAWKMPGVLLMLATIILITIGFKPTSDAPELQQQTITAYTLNLIAIILTLTVIYVGLRLFKFPRFRQSIALSQDDNVARAIYTRTTLIICIVMWATAIFNLIVAHLNCDLSPLWCALIVIIAQFFCLPTNGKLQQLRNNDRKQ